MTNLATDCLSKVSAIDTAMAPLVEKKEMELAKLHAVLNARLKLWYEQFDAIAPPLFDGERGFGFNGQLKNYNIVSADCLVNIAVDGTVVHATFDPGLFEENIFSMRLPLRYLDSNTGEAAIIQDANAFKAQQLSASENFSLGLN